MNKLTHITPVMLICIGLLVPTNGCGSKSPSSIQDFNCLTSGSPLINIPGTPNVRISTSYCEDYMFKIDKMSTVLHMFVDQYAKEFGMSESVVWMHIADLEIEVSAIPKIVQSVFDINGKHLPKAAVTGLALSPSKIWVEVKTNQIWSSSLAHELVHIIIWRQNGGVHADPDHEGDKYSGWTKQHTQFIKDFNRGLLDKDI